MPKARKMCFDRVLRADLHKPQRQRSVHGGRLEAISLIGKQWDTGRTIRIRFLEGTDNQKAMVRDIAPEWTNHANLLFEFTDDPTAEIRVTFDASDGAWSYVGTDNLDIPIHAATLNLGWQDEGVILHEFGHMIGLSHEHQNPEGGIQWNEDVVIADLAGPPNFWSPETTRRNVLNKYRADQLHGTHFDSHSIMLYEFPSEWTSDGFSAHANEKLSDLDQQFVQSAQMYPKDDPQKPTEISVSESVAAEISAPGERDLYKFDVDQSGFHIVQTLGTTDVVMTLFGPNNRSLKIAEDDESGAGRNAQISADLDAGTYYAEVRHFDEEHTGTYRVLVSR